MHSLSQTVTGSRTRKNAFECGVPIVARGQVYVHTIESFSRSGFSNEMKNILRKVTSGKLWETPIASGYGFKLFINNPTRETIGVLETFWTDRMSICALHIGFDFDPVEGVTREMITDLTDNYFHLKGRRAPDEMYKIGNTTYSTDILIRKNNGQRRPSKIAVSYSDRPGKLDGEVDKPRYELRFETGRSVRSLGVFTPNDLLEINPQRVFTKNVTIRDHAERIIAETIRTTKPTPYIDIPSRVRAMLSRTGMGHLSEWKKRVSIRHFERLVDRTDIVSIDPKLYFFPSVKIEEGVG